MFEGRRVFVTGGGGHLGGRIVETLLVEHSPTVVGIFDNSEQGLFSLHRRFDEFDSRIQFHFGDIRDVNRLSKVMSGYDVVIHTAGLKHVGFSEYHPFESVQTNVIGTHNVIQGALQNEVNRVIGLSTDKAATPPSVMGATKMLAERLLTAANQHTESGGTRFGSVRLGNVLGSHGSVVLIFLEQIDQGGPITITDPEMTRFLMSTDDAADFILQAGSNLTGGEVYIPKLSAFRITDLADAMITYRAPESVDRESIGFDVIGLRPGERIHEQLISRSEARFTVDQGDRYAVAPQIELDTGEDWKGFDQCSLDGPYSSQNGEFLSEEQLIDFLKQEQSI